MYDITEACWSDATAAAIEAKYDGVTFYLLGLYINLHPNITIIHAHWFYIFIWYLLLNCLCFKMIFDL